MRLGRRENHGGRLAAHDSTEWLRGREDIEPGATRCGPDPAQASPAQETDHSRERRRHRQIDSHQRVLLLLLLLLLLTLLEVVRQEPGVQAQSAPLEDLLGRGVRRATRTPQSNPPARAGQSEQHQEAVLVEQQAAE